MGSKMHPTQSYPEMINGWMEAKRKKVQIRKLKAGVCFRQKIIVVFWHRSTSMYYRSYCTWVYNFRISKLTLRCIVYQICLTSLYVLIVILWHGCAQPCPKMPNNLSRRERGWWDYADLPKKQPSPSLKAEESRKERYRNLIGYGLTPSTG
jgi:hypothetical protein